ncbi:MAG: hypothetical protein JF616_21785 [Fibrobacteres bacterium]|jgi:hypothetical protein|nr:hypothetical protein [Fibrobacterota bacterium]
MRELRYYLELTDAEHRDEAPISFTVAETLLRGMDWKLNEPDASPEAEPRAPFMLFLDESESFFMLMPEEDGLRVTSRVIDKWNLLGMMQRDKSFTLNFGVVPLEDALVLLKLFYEDNYPALRALEKRMA